MPTYDFRNTETGEEFTKVMKIAEKEQYMSENPQIQQVIASVALGDPVRLGIRKVPGGFKEVLQKVHQKTPGSELNTLANI